MKICHVASTDAGAVWVIEQLRGLRDTCGYEVTACVAGDRSGLADALRAEGIRVVAWALPPGGFRSLTTLPSGVLGLARLFRSERFDVVQTHLFVANIIGRAAAWLADVPVRLAMIAGPYHLETHTLRWIDRSTCWMDSALIASCEYTRRLYRAMEVPDSRLELVYYGADEKRFNPDTSPAANIREEYGLRPDTPLIGMVAYFYPTRGRPGSVPRGLHGRNIKGHEYLIRAMPAILREFPAARLMLIGSPFGEAGRQPLQELEVLIARLGLGDKVIFTGFRSDVPACLKALDVAVQPSLNENLGGTIEALLMACPLVATRVGGIVDSVREGETGLLVEPADPDDLARGILALLRDPALSRRLGRAGRALMLERFTLRHTVRSLSELYRRRLQERGDRAAYRLTVSCWRLMVLMPLSLFLAARLITERIVLGAWAGARAIVARAR